MSKSKRRKYDIDFNKEDSIKKDEFGFFNTQKNNLNIQYHHRSLVADIDEKIEKIKEKQQEKIKIVKKGKRRVIQRKIVEKKFVVKEEQKIENKKKSMRDWTVDDPIISVLNVDVKYNFGRPTEYHAIKNASVDIYKGEFVIFFGPSGCGKSTFVNTIAGLEKPTSGVVDVMGADITKYNDDELAEYHSEKIGFVFQSYNLIPSLSVEDNIILPQMFRDENRKKRKEKARVLLDEFEILEHARKRPVMLSGGQQQRVGIARSLVNDPEIILADEPMGNLDSANSAVVLDIFKKMSQKKKTILLVTHNSDLLKIANRVIYIRDGKIVREEINKDIRPDDIKKELITQEDVTIPVELRLLLRTYGDLSLNQLNSMWIPLKAKMITDQILQKYTREQIELVSDTIKRRLMGVITGKEVFSLMDLPAEKGGVGLDRRVAETLSKKVESILNEVKKIKDFIKIEDGTTEEQLEQRDDIITELRKQLLSLYHGHIIQKNIDRMEKIIKMRLENKIDKSKFISLVAKPLTNHGAGFNKKTAKNFARELELLMLIKFGEEKNI